VAGALSVVIVIDAFRVDDFPSLGTTDGRLPAYIAEYFDPAPQATIFHATTATVQLSSTKARIVPPKKSLPQTLVSSFPPRLHTLMSRRVS